MKRLAALLFFIGILTAPAAGGQNPSADFATGRLAIVTDSNRHEFSVELAITAAQRNRGLMFRREMAADAGMLFDFGAHAGRASMWMKNTYIPLDMLFIGEDGKIESIVERTTPQSLEAISSRGRVRYVLELNGGTASRLGIEPGDRVELPEAVLR